MARSFQLSALVTRARQRADMENSSFISDSEWKGIISSAYARLHSILAKTGLRYFEVEQQIATVATTVAATGSITCEDMDEFVQGETFTLHDGYGELVFEFDVTGDGVTAGNVRVNISGDLTAAEVCDTVTAVINAATHADGTAFRITANHDISDDDLSLTNDVVGPAGNRLSSETVAHTGFSVTNMTGGGGSYLLPSNYLSTVEIQKPGTSNVAGYRLNNMMVSEQLVFGSQPGTEASAYEIKGAVLYLYPFPPAGQTYIHRYIPQPTDLSSAADLVMVDVVCPEGEELLVWYAAVRALHKEESDTQVAERQLMMAQEAFEEWATLRFLEEPRRRMAPSNYGGDYYGVYDPGDWRYGR